MPFHSRTQKRAAMVCHRRMGKTVTCINEAVVRALNNRRSRPRYAYIAPLRSQAKKVAWEYCKEYTDGIQAKKPSESDLVVTINTPHNPKATIELYGADGPNAEALRGNYFDGAIVDEYGDMHPSILDKIILPTLHDRNGWLALIGTYKGKNHFYRKVRNYQGLDLPSEIDPEELARKYFVMVVRLDQSGVFSPEQILDIRQETDDESFRQEYMCDPDAVVKGTYYAAKLNELESQGRIFSKEAAYDPEQPVEAVMDIGRTDGFACWIWQKRPGGIALCDYFEMIGADVDKVFAALGGEAPGSEHRSSYRYRKIWMPHDAKAKTFATKRSAIEQFLEKYGTPVVDLVPDLGLNDGIAAVRKVLPMCYFDKRTLEGVDALRAYARKFDELTKSFQNEPMHNWASHPADAFRYLSIVAQPLIAEDKKPASQIIVPKGPVTTETLEAMFQNRERRLQMLRRRA